MNDASQPKDLHGWLDYVAARHPQAIELGLERVAAVAARMGLGRPAATVITVGGTNGKGSTVAFIEAIALAAGLRVGAYTSPHLLRYNERLRIEGVEAEDAALCAAFAAVEAARGDTPLTYFEFGTLAALWAMSQQSLDLAILEVGLGGRLDATNIVDPDVAVVTTVDLDHQDWLGHDREAIGAEKAGILRAGKPCVFGERDPPSSLLQRAYAIGAFAIRGHSDYLIERHPDHWVWREPGCEIELPWPALAAPAQLENAATAVAALRASHLSIAEAAIRAGISAARLPGRLQQVSAHPEVRVDVAHNPQAARQLASWLDAHPLPTVAVFSVLADKDLGGIVEALGHRVRSWHLAPILDAGPRGLDLETLDAGLAAALPTAERHRHGDLELALQAACREAGGLDGRVLVFGSFHTASAALAAFDALRAV